MEVGNFIKKLGIEGGWGESFRRGYTTRCGRMASQQPYKGNTSS